MVRRHAERAPAQTRDELHPRTSITRMTRLRVENRVETSSPRIGRQRRRERRRHDVAMRRRPRRGRRAALEDRRMIQPRRVVASIVDPDIQRIRCGRRVRGRGRSRRRRRGRRKPRARAEVIVIKIAILMRVGVASSGVAIAASVITADVRTADVRVVRVVARHEDEGRDLARGRVRDR